MLIYLITNRINGKQYVGQTTSTLEKRFQRHCWPSTAKSNMPISQAIQKYGKANFSIEILCTCSSQKELDLQEVRLSARLNTFSPNGYNLRVGTGPGSMSQETKNKISKSNKGRKVSVEARSNLSKAHLGIKHSEDTKRKISNTLKGRVISDKCREISSKVLSKSYSLFSPLGELTEITNLKQFCKSNSLHYAKMNEVANSKRTSYKGWTKPPAYVAQGIERPPPKR